MGKLLDWKPDMIRFMQDSVHYTQYPAKLAQIILPYLPPHPLVCDGGCGMGSLSLALAPYVKKVVGIDRSLAAISQLRQDSSSTPNIEALCTDLLQYTPPTVFDAMVFVQFGSIDDILQIASRCCRGTVVVISRNRMSHRFSAQDHTPLLYHYAGARAKLQQRGIAHSCKTFSLEMGQPFASLAQAQLFFSLYNPSSAITQQDLLTRLQPDPTGQYAYYMPVYNELGLLAFQTNTI